MTTVERCHEASNSKISEEQRLFAQRVSRGDALSLIINGFAQRFVQCRGVAVEDNGCGSELEEVGYEKGVQDFRGLQIHNLEIRTLPAGMMAEIPRHHLIVNQRWVNAIMGQTVRQSTLAKVRRATNTKSSTARSFTKDASIGSAR